MFDKKFMVIISLLCTSFALMADGHFHGRFKQTPPNQHHEQSKSKNADKLQAHHAHRHDPSQFVFDDLPTNGCAECLQAYSISKSSALGRFLTQKDNSFTCIDPKTGKKTQCRIIKKRNLITRFIQNNPFIWTGLSVTFGIVFCKISTKYTAEKTWADIFKPIADLFSSKSK